MHFARSVLRTFVLCFVIGILGLITSVLFQEIERKVIPWKAEEDGQACRAPAGSVDPPMLKPRRGPTRGATATDENSITQNGRIA